MKSTSRSATRLLVVGCVLLAPTPALATGPTSGSVRDTVNGGCSGGARALALVTAVVSSGLQGVPDVIRQALHRGESDRRARSPSPSGWLRHDLPSQSGGGGRPDERGIGRAARGRLCSRRSRIRRESECHADSSGPGPSLSCSRSPRLGGLAVRAGHPGPPPAGARSMGTSVMPWAGLRRRGVASSGRAGRTSGARGRARVPRAEEVPCVSVISQRFVEPSPGRPRY